MNKCSKKDLARRSIWAIEDVVEYYDLPRCWIEAVGLEVIGLQPDKEHVDRFLLERFLSSYGEAGATWMALSLGVTKDSLLRVMASPPLGQDRIRARYQKPFSLEHYAWGEGGDPVKYVFRQASVKEWLSRWLPQNSGSTEDLVRYLNLEPQYCAVSLDAKEEKPLIATTRCIVSWEPIALSHGEYSSYPKDMMLTPDPIGWHVIYHKEISEEWLWGCDMGTVDSYYKEQNQNNK